MTVSVGVRRLPHAADLSLPRYESAGAAGMDLLAAVPQDQPTILQPGARALIPTGLVIAIPEGFEGQVRPRSGLAAHHGVTVLNAPGTIDSDYRGEVKVILVNLGQEEYRVTRGLRIAQLLIAKVPRFELVESAEFNKTARDIGGFGSTGQ